ncbi:hypothetical protein ACA910_005132 [Epithemia clementina (nom. ined.)]
MEQLSSCSLGFRDSVCDAMAVGGFLWASAVTTITRSILSEEQVDSWGWRVPFLFSLALAPILYYIVGNAEESKLWSEATASDQLKDDAEDATVVVAATAPKKHDRPAVVDSMSSPFQRR